MTISDWVILMEAPPQFSSTLVCPIVIRFPLEWAITMPSLVNEIDPSGVSMFLAM
jgi:hypothetical protein